MARQILAAAEVRHAGWCYRAETFDNFIPTYGGAARKTLYYRYDGGWKRVSWDAVPKPAYRALRASLRGAFPGLNLEGSA